jgi:hypothetical protein
VDGANESSAQKWETINEWQNYLLFEQKLDETNSAAKFEVLQPEGSLDWTTREQIFWQLCGSGFSGKVCVFKDDCNASVEGNTHHENNGQTQSSQNGRFRYQFLKHGKSPQVSNISVRSQKSVSELDVIRGLRVFVNIEWREETVYVQLFEVSICKQIVES